MSKQLKAAAIDGLVLFLLLLPALVWFTLDFLAWDSVNHEKKKIISKNTDNLIGSFLYGYLIIFNFLLVLKDVLNLSTGKRKYNLTIVDRKNGNETHWLKKILRNITLFFTPTLLLEIALKLITPKARFGDMILDTEVREVQNDF